MQRNNRVWFLHLTAQNNTTGSPAKETQNAIIPLQLTDSNFERRIVDCKIPVMVDMWAPWCKPCLAVKPTIRQRAQELHGEVEVAELNLEDNPLIAKKYVVDRYPMFLVFVDGSEVARIVGTQTRESLLASLSIFTEKKDVQ